MSADLGELGTWRFVVAGRAGLGLLWQIDYHVALVQILDLRASG